MLVLLFYVDELITLLKIITKKYAKILKAKQKPFVAYLECDYKKNYKASKLILCSDYVKGISRLIHRL